MSDESPSIPEWWSPAQHTRAQAILLAHQVLTNKTGGLTSSSTTSVPVDDLLSIAEYILRGFPTTPVINLPVIAGLAGDVKEVERQIKRAFAKAKFGDAR